MDLRLRKKLLLAISLFLIAGGAQSQSGVWSGPTQITDLGAWAIWFGVVVSDTQVAPGCAPNSSKALDLSNVSTALPATTQAQISLLLTAFSTGKPVKLYYDHCAGGVSIITNVHMVGS